MRKTKIIFLLIVAVVISATLFQAAFWRPDKNVSAAKSYLPKADLIKGSGHEVYLLENGVRRWIEDPEIFANFNYDWKNIKVVSDSVLEEYPLRDNLRKYDDYPDGSLLRGAGPRVYLIELGRKRWIPTPTIFTANEFGWKYIIKVDEKILEDIEAGPDLTIAESNRYPDTVILSEPGQNEVIKSSEVAFKFSGTNPLGPRTDLSFETFLAGEDDYWQSSYNDEEDYRLSAFSATYTFYVRAKNKQGYVDPSPAAIRFSVGLSSYYGQVRIARVEPDEENFREDYIVLENNDDDERTIDITGWKIETKKTSITIPQAVEKLKYPFTAKDNSDVKLPYRGEAVISFGAAPQGVNFQANLCAGYLAQGKEFFPSLNNDCPQPEESEYSGLKKVCRDFIDALSRCELPDYSGNLDVAADSQCTGFLNDTFGYQNCYSEHNQEVDFFSGEWRIFLNKPEDVLGDENETITLKDRSGQVVDRYSY